ncbi:YqfO family protein [Spartinivicinus poritis]|uniref:YqfO family protein n=1 Tax=Spartinivicinus poritis TaxID=2994640 RepID=A0ABT5U2N6_9GAMM|nr:YqfO family protein [Spartinivicinus sp. A2-2]MDE1460485.1 YqfO family protein [Spartinivicinus sp. A2-2]
MYKIAVFIPEEALESVKSAMFQAGAGKIGDYDSCAWQVKGQGQFRPLAGSNPYVGQMDQVETVEEYRVEMVCADQYVTNVIQAMKQAHPYEEPAYDVWQLADLYTLRE